MTMVLPQEPRPPFITLVVQFLVTLGVVVTGLVSGLLTAGIIASAVTGVSSLEVQQALADGTIGILDPNAVITTLQILQAGSILGMMVLPALLLPKVLLNTSPLRFLRLDRMPGGASLVLIFLLWVAAAPLTALLVELNQNIQFPAFLAEAEQYLRQKQEQVEAIQQYFLVFDTPWRIVSSILIIALLAAVAEEMLFRGYFQRLFTKWSGNAHIAIWTTALLFSAIHMQFYESVPRFLLGAMLGYIFYWTGSLWAPIFFHFVNNMVALLPYLLYHQGVLEQDPAAPIHFPVSVYFLSAALTAFFLFQLRRRNGPEIGSLTVTESGTLVPQREKPARPAHHGRWAVVYTTTDTHSAEIMAGRLESAGIPAIILNKRDSAYSTFGQIEVHVPEDEFEHALVIVKGII